MSAPQPGLAKLVPDPTPLLPHLQFSDEAASLLEGGTVAALARLEGAGLLMEATRLAAFALPAREAVWWACMCARHTASSAEHPVREAAVCAAAEEWVRRPTDAQRRAAMALAQEAGFNTPESWAATAAFWSGDSMAPPEAPKVPPGPHLVGLAAAGAVALAALRGKATLRDERLRRFLASARDVASGGPGRIEPEG
jgi:hypothetical protein